MPKYTYLYSIVYKYQRLLKFKVFENCSKNEGDMAKDYVIF